MDMHELEIDKEVGMEFCGGMEDLYEEVIADYIGDRDTRKENLTKYHAEKDWKNYAIEAHALKTTSKTIGATNFAEHARLHEFAAKEENASYIEEDFDNFMESYDALVASLQ